MKMNYVDKGMLESENSNYETYKFKNWGEVLDFLDTFYLQSYNLKEIKITNDLKKYEVTLLKRIA